MPKQLPVRMRCQRQYILISVLVTLVVSMSTRPAAAVTRHGQCESVFEVVVTQLDRRSGESFDALQELERSCRFIGSASYSGHFGARDTLIALAGFDDLEESQAKLDLMRDLFRIDWQERDGQNASKGDLAARARIYQGLILIASFYNARNTSVVVDLAALHTAAGVRTLIHHIRGTDFTPLGKKDRKFFMGKQGSFAELDFVSDALLASASFESDFGLRDTVFKLASFLDQQGESDEQSGASPLLLKLKRIAWGAKDGGSAKRGGKGGSGLVSAQDRAYEGIYLVAEEFNRRYPEDAVDLNTLYKADSFRSMYETLVGVRYERLPERVRVIFMGEEGTFRAFRQAGRGLGMRYFSRDHGARDIITALMKSDELKEGPGKEELYANIDRIRWGSNDGGNAMKTGSAFDGIASNTGGGAQDRIFTAIVLIAKLYNAQHPRKSIPIDTLYKAETFKLLVQRLGFDLFD